MQAKGILLLALVAAMLAQSSQAVYFYAQKAKWRCFSDTVVKNNVSALGRPGPACLAISLGMT